MNHNPVNAETRTLALKQNDTELRWVPKFLRDHVLQRLTNLKQGGISIRDPWGELHVGDRAHICQYSMDIFNPLFYFEVALGGSNGAAAAWRDGYWTCNDLTGLFSLLLKNTVQIDAMESGIARLGMWWYTRQHRSRQNTRSGSARNIHDHYDLGNDLFRLFLDETMTYSAAIFSDARATLKQASVNKLDHICRKLRVGRQDHLLEIGTGWGSFAIHAAKFYGCKVTTTTISQQQYELAFERVNAEGLSDQIEVLVCDYRDLNGHFDKLVSIEMIEAVGHEFLPVYFGKCASLLKPDGQMLLQAITMPDRRYEQYLKQTDFIQQFIFPGSCVPSFTAIQTAVNTGSDFKITQVEDIGPHYATTLRHWLNNFTANEQEILKLGYTESFVRLWKYYLCYCEAGFQERYLGNLQILLHKPQCRAEPVLPAFRHY